jgi:flagellar hook protein FlgE
MRVGRHFLANLAVLRCCVAGLFAVAALSSTFATTEATGRPTDLAIVGSGYFMVRDADGRRYLTRRGEFVIDAQGYLVSVAAFRVQGYGPDLVTAGDIRIAAPAGGPWLAGFQIQADGNVIAILSDGIAMACGQILLTTGDGLEQGIRFPGGLILAREIDALPAPKIPGTGGAGTLLPQNIEISEAVLAIGGSAPRFSAQYVGTDLAIRGRGFFVLRDPTTGAFYGARAGALYWDPDGYLINYAGLRVQAKRTADDSAHDLQMHSLPDGSEIIYRSIDWWGQVSAPFNEQLIVIDRLALKEPLDPQSLTKNRFGAYELTAANWSDYEFPGESGFGHVFAGALDLREMSEDIIAARKQMNFFIRGAYVNTGVETDLYINSELGMFIVRDPGSNTLHATRNGEFRVDTNGWLVTLDGFRVQGNVAGQVGDIVISVAKLASIRIDSSGEIVVFRSNGTQVTVGQILLQDFRNPHALTREANNLYGNIENALPRFPNGGAAPDTFPLGGVKAGALEAIQLDPGIQIPPANAVCLQITDLPPNGRVEASTDMRDWTAVDGVFGADTGTISFFDLSASSSGARFYRVMTPPTPQNISIWGEGSLGTRK